MSVHHPVAKPIQKPRTKTPYKKPVCPYITP
jgi:hypothetical protein